MQTLGIAAQAYRDYTEHFAALGEEAEEKRAGPEHALWRNRIEAEQDNFRGALSWALECEPPVALRITAAVGEFWLEKGYWSELGATCEKALAATTDNCSEWRARCMRLAGRCAEVQGEPARAHQFFEQSLELSEKCGSAADTVQALHHLASVLVYQRGRQDEARPLFDRALEIAQQVRDERRMEMRFFTRQISPAA